MDFLAGKTHETLSEKDDLVKLEIVFLLDDWRKSSSSERCNIMDAFFDMLAELDEK